MNRHPWRRALVWLVLLGTMFVYGYSLTNAMAAQRADVLILGHEWDQRMPFVAWTILPYLSINLIYPCAFFAFEDRRALDRFALRLFTAQTVCFAVFYAVPTGTLRRAPAVSGPLGVLFKELRAFEQPFNMVPSLHVVALVVLWSSARHAVPRALRALWDGGCLLVLVSTVTTWQHDLIDVGTGLVVGAACLLVRAPLSFAAFKRSTRS